ncbi:MAG: hypothetical protein LBB17_02635 [Puniceicoccales bacterium]|jgi:hypothetical protein|nr:hypothetical protein [Puniceicoccales bacterium]
MPEFEEWSKGEGESKENDAGQAPEKNQARYALKRGRIPQVRNFTENDEAAVVGASIVDVEHDAIGVRSQGKPVADVSPIKKSTEIVEESGHVTPDKRSRSHQKTIRHENEQKTKFHGGKVQSHQTHSREAFEKCPSPKSRSKLFRFWKKFLKLFGIKSKDFESSEDRVWNQKKRHTVKQTNNFRTPESKARKAIFQKK